MAGLVTEVAKSLASAVAPKITVEEAIEYARQECDRRNWGWCEPIWVRRALFSYHLVTNADCKGGNAFISISLKDGKVLSAKFFPY